MKKTVSPELHKFFSENGKKGGDTLLEKYGPDYFKRISAMRKVHGKQKSKVEEKPTEENTPKDPEISAVDN